VLDQDRERALRRIAPSTNRIRSPQGFVTTRFVERLHSDYVLMEIHPLHPMRAQLIIERALLRAIVAQLASE
jgi:hypothetical protein